MTKNCFSFYFGISFDILTLDLTVISINEVAGFSKAIYKLIRQRESKKVKKKTSWQRQMI